MTIDLARFTKEEEQVVPVINGLAYYDTRIINCRPYPDGFWVAVSGSRPHLIHDASPLEIEEFLSHCNALKGFAFGNDAIPINFENFARRGLPESVEITFMNAEPWDVIVFCEWKGRMLFKEVDFSYDRTIINAVRDRFDKEQAIDKIKGVTPEIRYLYLLLSLQRQNFRQIEALEKLKLSQAERAKRIEEFKNTFAGRIKHTVESAGAKLVSFEKVGNNKYRIAWRVGGQTIKSTVDDNFKVQEIGFCAVNNWMDHQPQDKNYFLSSAIALAQEFQEERDVYILRD